MFRSFIALLCFIPRPNASRTFVNTDFTDVDFVCVLGVVMRNRKVPPVKTKTKGRKVLKMHFTAHIHFALMVFEWNKDPPVMSVHWYQIRESGFYKRTHGMLNNKDHT